MVDRVNKALLRMSAKERLQSLELLERIRRGEIKGLDVKKLKGYDSAYRVRNGTWRIIFRKVEQQVELISIERRSDTTY
jgi:mRNA-degrading endonuclease RelE of RelBE toxin-antitoxin system